MRIREAELSIGKWHAQTYDGRRMVSVSREGIRQGRLSEFECNIARVLLADAATWIRRRRRNDSDEGTSNMVIRHMGVYVLFSQSFGWIHPESELYLVRKGSHTVLNVRGTDEMKDVYTLLASIWHK